MTVDLVLGRPLGPQPGGAVALVLGRAGTGGGGGPVDPPTLPDPRSGALRMSVAARWSPAARVAPGTVRCAWAASILLGGAWAGRWAAASALQAGVRAPWAATVALDARRLTSPWATTVALGSRTTAPWISTQPLGAAWTVRWAGAAAQAARIAAPWQRGAAIARTVTAPWQAGRSTSLRWRAGAGQGLGAWRVVRAPWQAGVPVESIGGPLVPLTPPEPVPCWQPEPGGAVDLVLKLALRRLGDLVLACRRVAIRAVPVRRVYMVTNVTSLVRVSDGTAIPCLSFSLSLDVDSWAWGFSASLPATALSLIEPDAEGEPVVLEASVNGTAFRVLAESMSRERSFGQASVRLQGRGHTAVLDAPYSPLQTFSAASTLTTQQLLDQALPSGWSADFGLTPWLVPGGVWSHQGSPITAALAIAAAGGGYLQPHATSQVLRVLPRYPTAPWDWGSVTPDIELPAAVVTREGIEWVERARYNRVFVSGANTGVLGRVTRAGTAGDVVAQMVTDPLITHVDGARQRGLPVLAEGGRKAMVTLRLPVLAETGVLLPGTFVRYVDGSTTRLGLVRSAAVDVGLAAVWQSIKVESHVN